jgi:hypothetical protein
MNNKNMGRPYAYKFRDVKHDRDTTGIGNTRPELIYDLDILQKEIIMLGDFKKEFNNVHR